MLRNLRSLSRSTSYDYIIIGAGSAGSLLAKRLSEDVTKRVLLVEAGPSDEYYLPIHIPVGYLHCIGNKRTDWCYNTIPMPSLHNRVFKYPRGKTLGGCSSINGMIYMRGQQQDYDHWSNVTRDERWSWQHMLPYFKKHEDFKFHNKENSHLHGKGGEWRVEDQKLHWKALDLFINAAQECGIPANDDFNSGNNEGVGYFHVTQRDGWRLNAYQAFVRPIEGARSNLDIVIDTHVEKLLFESDPTTEAVKCVGVHCAASSDGSSSSNDGFIALTATREVILSAGAVGDVQILERSGIGNGERLTRLDIPIISDLPGVGENLQDHLQIRPVYSVQRLETLNSRANSLLGKAKIGLEYMMYRSGPMAMAPSQLGCFARSSDVDIDDDGTSNDNTSNSNGSTNVKVASANLEFHVQPLSLDSFSEPLHSFDAITPSVCNIRPSSRGSVHITDTHRDSPPDIDPNYLSTAEDQHIAAQSLLLARKIMTTTEAFKPYNVTEVKPGIETSDKTALVQAAKQLGTTIFHPVGTCKMTASLKSDSCGVVNSDLQVYGVAGLRVCDASIMPTITSGNTAAPTMAIAEALADRLIQAHT